jgi:hypothetical protein
MKAQPATQEKIQTTPSKCTSGPDCPCEFCVSLRAKHCRRPIGERHRKAIRRRLPPLVFAQAYRVVSGPIVIISNLILWLHLHAGAS